MGSGTNLEEKSRTSSERPGGWSWGCGDEGGVAEKQEINTKGTL